MSMRGSNWLALLLLLSAGVAHAEDLADQKWAFPWGDGARALGRLDPNESDAEGPASFLVNELGETLVLDQVGSRIARFDKRGHFIDSIALPGTSYMEMDQLPNGRLLLLDRLVKRTILLVDELLGVVEEYPVEGELIDDSGAVTAMFVRDDGLWLEVSHTYSVRVLGLDWLPCARVLVPGRPARAGPASLVARLASPHALHIALQDGMGRATWSQELVYADSIERIVWVEDLVDGRTVVVVHTRNESTGKEYLRATRLTASGKVEAAGEVPYVVAIWYLQRDVRIRRDGSLLRMWYDDSGVHIDDWRLP